jgi:protein-disulfide isomerase
VKDDLRSSPIPPPCSEDHVRGPAGITTVIFYGDFTCPYCASAYQQLRGIRIRLAFRHFALKSRPRAVALAAAAEAAARQGAFWEMHDALFSDPAHTEDPDLWRHVQQLGLDLDRFQADRRSEVVLERIRRDLQSGLRGGVASTPTLVLDGVVYPGPPTGELLAMLAPMHVR